MVRPERKLEVDFNFSDRLSSSDIFLLTGTAVCMNVKPVAEISLISLFGDV